MYYVKKILIGLLIFTTLNFYTLSTSFSEEIIFSTRDNITTHSPESVSTPEKDISGETTVSEGKGKGWLWVALAIIAVAGGAAGAGSGGGNGGGNNGGSTGSINVSW